MYKNKRGIGYANGENAYGGIAAWLHVFYAYISLPLFMTPTKQFFIYYYQIIILSNDIILV